MTSPASPDVRLLRRPQHADECEDWIRPNIRRVWGRGYVSQPVGSPVTTQDHGRVAS